MLILSEKLNQAEELNVILQQDKLTAVFQPIVDLKTAQGIGYEALTRGPSNSTLHSPFNLFQVAQECDRSAELEYACRENSCQRFAELEGCGKLFINVSPMVLLSKDFREGMTQKILDRCGLKPDDIVIELSEQYPLDDYELIRKATKHYRAMGFEIAIDDLGSGYAGLRVWNEIRPDYVKIDRHFIDGIDSDLAKQEFVRSIQKIAERLSCKVIAEGIETIGQLRTVQNLNIFLGQGYYLSRPEPYLKYELPSDVAQPDAVFEHIPNQLLAGDLAQTTKTVAVDASFESVVELFRNDKKLCCLPAVVNDYVVGHVSRHFLLELLAWPFSLDLYGKNKVADFMSTSVVKVDRYTPTDELGIQLAAQDDQEVASYFIVTDNGRYYGVGKTRQLLKILTENRLQNARYASPLTQLPGNLLIDSTMKTWMASKEDFRVAYLDLNNFKPFNDCYGYKAGDDVIVALAKLAENAIDPQKDYIGHIGGDDFMILFRSIDWRVRCTKIIEQFDALSPSFYDEHSKQKGGIHGVDRAGNERFFRLLGLAIGVVHPDLDALSSFRDISTLSADAKHQAKQSEYSRLFVSRRRKPHRLKETVLKEDALVLID